MQKSLLALAAILAITALPTIVKAQEASPLTFNVSLASDYRYRGVSQTRLKPAIQGGVDYAHSSGFYVGAWASSIKWIKDSGGNADAEVDVYGGYKGSIMEGLGFDAGVLTYQYPGHDLAVSPNTTELYGALTYGPATLKYSHSTTNLFGVADSKNSGYLDLSATFDVGGGVTVTPHVGHQKIENNGSLSYTDYAVAVNKDWYGFTFGAALIGADVDEGTYLAPNGKKLARTKLVASVKKVF